MAYFGD